MNLVVSLIIKAKSKIKLSLKFCALSIEQIEAKLRSKIWAQRLQKSRGWLVRALLCWSIGCFILTSDEVTSYDTRFQLRGEQKSSDKIVLVTIHPTDLSSASNFRNRNFGPLHEITDITDSFYWDPTIWTDLLKKILQQNPEKIGVTLFFSESLVSSNLSIEQAKILKDTKVIWGANANSSDKTNYPLLADELRSNIGNVNLTRDDDGIIRRFSSNPLEGPHIVEKLSLTALPRNTFRYINYRGTSKAFQTFDVRDILEGRVSKEVFQNKIVIIGSENPAITSFVTPLGGSPRHEIIGQIVDNFLQDRWIYRANNSLYFILLAVLVGLAISIILGYPQSVALVLIFGMVTMLAALSCWFFDSFYFWIPIVSTTTMLGVTWVTFIGYQAHQIEMKNWELQQEQKYHSELEQLKNNFVSLISHDLKTPIAKIQAIVDRLLTMDSTLPFSTDLKSLRVSSEELNRYIQSILKVLRVESRDFQLNKEVADINEIIDEAVVQLYPLAFEKQISIDKNLEPMFSVEVDITLIREVMVNLIENAVKYTPAGGKITVHSEESANKIWISVTDTGEGISPIEMQNVWGKFVRGKDQDMKTKGSGLGLYLVKYFIELHGGEVFLKSELKKGTSVSFCLPIEDSNPELNSELNSTSKGEGVIL